MFFVILSLIILIFLSKKEGLITTIDEEVNVPVKNKDLVVRIQLNCLVQPGTIPWDDAWINLGDITIRDRNGNQINYGNTTKVHFSNYENWDGLPVQNLWDDNKASMGHSRRGLENLIIKLDPVAVGSVQITNRQDCCWHRVVNHELVLYNNLNDPIANIKLDRLYGQGKTVKYNFTYPL